MVKNPSASAGDAKDVCSISGSGRSPGVGNGSILAWKIGRTEEPGRLQSVGMQSQTPLSSRAHKNKHL